jgi:hypothetical protein
MRAFLFVMAVGLATPAVAGDIPLGLPIACEIGKTCWVQQYPDDDPSSGIRDHACGGQSYDGHDGTDIRVLDTSVKADVVAAAPGTVTAFRDGVPDRLVKDDEDRKAVADRECGNGVVISHADGWETQYCHMREGSLAVTKGQRVEVGDRLGAVGYSGLAAFPHVHLSVRKAGKKIDPFLPGDPQACGTSGPWLWNAEAAKSLAYVPGSIIATGFAAGPVGQNELETGALLQAGTPMASWPALVAYAWMINLEAGDEIVVQIDGPGDFRAGNRDVLTRRKAQYLLFAGKKRPIAGAYAAKAQIFRNEKLYLERTWSTNIR